MLFCLQRLCLDLRNFQTLDSNFSFFKYNFCIDFEKEIDIPKSQYSEDVFDFLYNIYNHKKVFKGNKFKQIQDDFLGLNFNKVIEVGNYINNIYTEMAFYNRDYFYEIFKFDDNDPKKIAESFGKNLQENYDKFLKHF
jgi:hypothetical protein